MKVVNIHVLLAVLFFGASVTATKAIIQDVSPLTLALLRYVIGSALLFALIVMLSRTSLRIEKRDVAILTLLGFILFALFPVTFNIGLQHTEASRGALLLATMPVWSVLIAKLAGSESLRPLQISGVLLTIVGIAIVQSERGLDTLFDTSTLLGDGLLLLTACLGAVYGILAKPVVSRYSPLTVTSYAMLFGTVLLLPVLLVEPLPQADQLSMREISLILFLGTFGGGLGWYLWTYGLKHLSPTQVAVYVNLNPIAATVLAAVFLNETITPVFLAGFATVVLGIIIVNWPARTSIPTETERAS